MYLSTASGSSRQSLESRSSRAKPVCFDRVSNTSGPIACSSSAGVMVQIIPTASGVIAKDDFAEPATKNPASTGTTETGEGAGLIGDRFKQSGQSETAESWVKTGPNKQLTRCRRSNNRPGDLGCCYAAADARPHLIAIPSCPSRSAAMSALGH